MFVVHKRVQLFCAIVYRFKSKVSYIMFNGTYSQASVHAQNCNLSHRRQKRHFTFAYQVLHSVLLLLLKRLNNICHSRILNIYLFKYLYPAKSVKIPKAVYKQTTKTFENGSIVETT